MARATVWWTWCLLFLGFSALASVVPDVLAASDRASLRLRLLEQLNAAEAPDAAQLAAVRQWAAALPRRQREGIVEMIRTDVVFDEDDYRFAMEAIVGTRLKNLPPHSGVLEIQPASPASLAPERLSEQGRPSVDAAAVMAALHDTPSSDQLGQNGIARRSTRYGRRGGRGRRR